LLTEASGVPIGLAIDGANRHDSKLVKATIESIAIERPEPTEKEPQGMPLDKAYDSVEVRDLVKQFGYTAHIRARGE
jgi:putative transposase